jgi:hypothetical protein
MHEIKCIYIENEFVSNSHVRSELWTESQKGKRAPLLRIVNGIRATLKVTSKGFMLTNAHNEVLREGTATDVFEIYDSMMFSVNPLEVETEDFTATEEWSVILLEDS